MDAHRIKILDRADDDDVVVEVAHHLKLVFFPAKDRFFDKDLRGRRCRKASACDLLEFFGIERGSAACSTESKARADDRRVADLLDDLFCLFPSVSKSAFGRLNADLVHRGLKKLAILAHLDRVDICADQSYSVFLKYAFLVEFDREIQAGLAADGRQDGVRPFFFNYRGESLDRKRLDVGPVGDLGIGHYRRRIGVYENDRKAFLFECSTGLRSRIVEFAGLSDDDRSGTNDQDLLYIVSTRHFVNLRLYKKGAVVTEPPRLFFPLA